MASDCILCGKCLSVCPLIAATNREELGPRAKSDLARLLEEQPDLLKGKDVKELASLCLGCGRCKTACSRGVDVPALVSAMRNAHPDMKSWLWKTWLSNSGLWSKSASAASLIPKEFQPSKLGQQLKMLAGLKGESGIKPFLSVESFPDTYRGEKMLLFAGCTATHVQTRWLIAAMHLLDGLGIDLLPAEFECCGGSLKSAGYADEAVALARKNIEVWRTAGRPNIITFCASCLSGLDEYTEFKEENEAKQWKESLTPLSQLLGEMTFSLGADAPETVGYHRPCHVDEADSDYRFLKPALGKHFSATTKDECCGFGGIMQLAAPQLGATVNAICWERIVGSRVVLTGCSACATQLAATAPDEIQVGHWLETICPTK